MPPSVPRKRQLSNSPEPVARKRQVPIRKDHGGVFRALDDLESPRGKLTAKEASKMLAQGEEDDGDGDGDSSSAEDEDEFEDVFRENDANGTKSDEEDWEDAMLATPEATEIQDLELTITHPDEFSLPVLKSSKKGPTKIEREIRINTHRMHVLCLLRLNSVRNHWLNDSELHEILLTGLSPGIKSEVERWKRASGLLPEERIEKPSKYRKPSNSIGKRSVKAEENRDWGTNASRLEPGVPDMSGGDPTIRLLKYLSAYWKKRFKVVGSSLRKQGYKSVKERDTELKTHRQDPTLPAFGEIVKGLPHFRELARKCEGSRDVGCQLFTGLLRALGLEARMVASLQPAGFGWSQVENTVTSDTKAESSNKPESTPNPSWETVLKSKANKIDESAKPLDVKDSNSELSDIGSISTDSDMELLSASKSSATAQFQLPFPTYWTEVRGLTNQYIPVSVYGTPSVASAPEALQQFEPKGALAEKAKQVICYVVSYYSDHAAKDVTVRYLRKHIFPGKTKGFRLPPEKVPIYNKRGKIVSHVEVDWFEHVMRMYARPRKSRTPADDIEDKTDLIPQKITKTMKSDGDGIPDTLQGFKNSTEYVLERHLRREEAILPTAESVKQFTVGKGANTKTEPVYLRKDVVACKTVESWHKEGREIKKGEQPLKHVPIRAVTWVRKMEVEQTARETGEKPLQGLYSRAQTDWIIPPPIQDGIIPKNAYGNIDIYVPSMIPKGAVHVPLRGTVRICKKLGIDYAEACVGFEFGNQMAVPVIEGVVVAEENGNMLVDAWKAEEERKRIKEEEKKAKEARDAQRKKVVGKQIKERLNAEYGDHNDLEAEKKQDSNKQMKVDERHRSYDEDDHESFGGGFLVEDEEHSTRPAISNVDEPASTKKKAAPRSLRSHLHEESTPMSLSDEEEGDLNEDDDGSDDDEDEDGEYEDFARRRTKASRQTRVETGIRRSTRTTAQTSPYFKRRK